MNRQPPVYPPYPTAWLPGAYPPAANVQQHYNPYVMPAAYPTAASAPAPIPTPATTLGNPRFIKGALIGALAAYLLTNENFQQAAIRGGVKAWSLVQGGVEEMKERFRDAEAELHAAQASEPDTE